MPFFGYTARMPLFSRVSPGTVNDFHMEHTLATKVENEVQNELKISQYVS